MRDGFIPAEDDCRAANLRSNYVRGYKAHVCWSLRHLSSTIDRHSVYAKNRGQPLRSTNNCTHSRFDGFASSHAYLSYFFLMDRIHFESGISTRVAWRCCRIISESRLKWAPSPAVSSLHSASKSLHVLFYLCCGIGFQVRVPCGYSFPRKQKPATANQDASASPSYSSMDFDVAMHEVNGCVFFQPHPL